MQRVAECTLHIVHHSTIIQNVSKTHAFERLHQHNIADNNVNQIVSKQTENNTNIVNTNIVNTNIVDKYCQHKKPY